MRLLLLSALLFLGVVGAPNGDEVVSLPGLSFVPNFKHYSGYLQASSTKYFHYWFTESSRKPSLDPLILWLNGGPGCSSLEGLIEELGPFKVQDFGKTVYLNPYSWNSFANVLFLESPAGVGFSYSVDGNITVSDDDVALQNYNSLVQFIGKFPEYKGRDFYITGESYGGVYLPTLAVLILSDKINFPNFKGMAVGNGAVNFPNNYNTMVPLYYYHALVRDELYQRIAKTCCNGHIEGCDIFGKFSDPTCRNLIIEALNGTNDLNPYNLYYTCYYSPDGISKHAHIEKAMRRIAGLPVRTAAPQSTVPLCAQTNNTYAYLNRADVRRALHIPSSLPLWNECSNDVLNVYKTTHFEMTPEFEKIIAAGVKVLVYNGDVDTVCNHVMNAQFLSNLNRTILGNERVNEPWRFSGETPEDSVAGFQLKYSGNVDFVTVRGSGHFVPQDRPREALQLIFNFVNNRDYSLAVDLTH
ncbi:unnamed protein product [Caenorhabditis auriculariae]|uniref:Carboxypeptidase n=1 Tax=Caenorhabditis auriculariae TaxID=2777116 RepID=A0A8S1HA21_9PELO|nr:unnamed protein product [Caenorhabditis auriculariae]